MAESATAPPATRYDYPIEVRDGYLHFFQNRMPWERYAVTFVPHFMANLLFRTLRAEEFDQYTFAVHPGDARLDFVSFCVAHIRDDQTQINDFYCKHGKMATLQRFEVVAPLFRPETLRHRASESAISSSSQKARPSSVIEADPEAIADAGHV